MLGFKPKAYSSCMCVRAWIRVRVKFQVKVKVKVRVRVRVRMRVRMRVRHTCDTCAYEHGSTDQLHETVSLV